MFVSNAHYGHRTILNRHAGVPEGTPIPGLVEHGWNYDLGATLEDVLLPHPDPFFLWSERNLRACKEAGIGDRVAAIGAPFLYLPPLEEPIEAEPGSLLVMPTHGWEKAKLEHNFEFYARSLGEIEKEFRSVTVCLYWFEHQEPRYRRPFEERGYRVITSGARDKNPHFLHDLRRLLLRYEYVASNRVGTATFYALHLGRKFFAHGPPVGVEQRLDRTGMLYDAWQRREYPTLMWETFRDEPNRDLGASELGLPFMHTKDELLDRFLWRPEKRRALEACMQGYEQMMQRRARAARIEPWRKALSMLPIVGRYVPRGS
jgi:hypothetical protein